MPVKNLRLAALLVGALFCISATGALAAPIALAPLGGVPPGQSSASGTITAPGSAQTLSLAGLPANCSVTLSGATTFRATFQLYSGGQWSVATNLGASGVATAAGYYSGAVDPTAYTAFSFSVTSITAGQVLTYSESCPASGGGGGGGSTLTFGTHLTGTSYNGSAPVTLGTDAASANTASTIVARDANSRAVLSVTNPISAAVSAAGNSQGTATALTSNINIVTTVAASTGVALPTAVAGQVARVANEGANALAVYPASGAAIDALAANTAYTVPVGATVSFVAASATQWYVTPNAGSVFVNSTDDGTTNATYCPIFQTVITAGSLKTDCSNLKYNPSTHTLTAGTLVGALTGNASTATGLSAAAAACSAANVFPCAFTWTCTMSSGVCTTTQAVPATATCTISPTVSPELSSTNVVSTWVTLATTTLTVHVSDLLGTSSAAFSGNGVCV